MNANTGTRGERATVEGLLRKMTLAQKLGQMVQTERQAISPEEVKAWHIGSVLSGGGSCPGENRPQDWVDMNDAYWAASMEEDAEHLAIPIIYGIDAVHGNNNVRGATVFPHNIGLGAANDPDMMERIAQVTAKEVLACGVEWTFAPTLAVARDHHWGRTYESYSEHPDIVCSYAGRFVRGLQGDLGSDGVVACVKHWVGDGGTTHGIEQGNTEVSEAELRRLHMAGYLPALRAGVLSVMVSFNSWNGVKCHGHKYLVTDVLKQELGFAGCVISDWDGIDYVSESYAEAIAIGVNAGIDMFMISEQWRPFLQFLSEHVADGTVPMERIDDAVRRILGMKMAYGLFEKPRPAERVWSAHESFGSREHRDVAREAVRKSLVLLKNDNGTLPLSKDHRILVAGKNADNIGHQCGGFTVAWQGTSGNEYVEGGTSIWQGIRELVPGATLSRDGSGEDADPDRHDVAIVVVGERPYAEGLGDIRPGRDRAVRVGSQAVGMLGAAPVGDDRTIQVGSQLKGTFQPLAPYGTTSVLAELHPEDLATIARIAAKGIPVVTVLVSGRPLATDLELEASAAFVAAWLPGSEGKGVAEVLFGDAPFVGKLSFSWPRSPGAKVNVGDADYAPLFPYGYGLGAWR